MGFSRQEYWSGLPFPPPGNLPNPGIEPVMSSPALEGRFFTVWVTRDSFLKKLRPIHMSWHETPTTCGKIKTRILVSDHTPYPAAAAAAKSLQSCPTLCDSKDAQQAPLSLGSSRQEYWSGLPFPSPMHACMLSRFSHVRLCATPWTAAHQAPLSTGFSRQEYWSGLPFPLPLILLIWLKTDIRRVHQLTLPRNRPKWVRPSVTELLLPRPRPSSDSAQPPHELHSLLCSRETWKREFAVITLSSTSLVFPTLKLSKSHLQFNS